MLSLSDALSRAIVCQQQQKLPEAEQLCAEILKASPDHFDARHFLAIVRHQQGRTTEGIDLLAAALRNKPDSPSALSNYGLMLQELKRYEDALASYDRALALRPDFPEALNNRATVLAALGRHADALASYDKALALNPLYAEAFYNRGTTLDALKRDAEALASYDQALAVQPLYPEALNSRGAALSRFKRCAEALASHDKALALRPDFPETLNNRGAALSALKRPAEALASYDRALALRPDYAEAHYNRAVTLDELKRYAEALASCDRALALRPDYPEALNNRGIVLDELGRHEQALASYAVALALKPDYAEALNNRGTAQSDLGRFDEARASYDAALAILPDYEECHWNRSLLMLRLGSFAEGWREYEWRRNRDSWEPRQFQGPQWAGEPSAKLLLVYAEQGLGDTIQFARFARALAKAGHEVVLEVQPPLRGLLGSLAGVTVIRKGEPLPRFDAHLPLMSLPHVLRIAECDLSAQRPYLAADPDRVERWAATLWRDDVFTVGIAWQGNPKAPGDKGRSIPLAAFAPLAAVPGVRFVSLQKHDGVDQLAGLPEGMRIESLGDDLDAGPDAFVDSAAVMTHLDLIVTSDTAMAHLAGALGRPVWIPLKHVPDWRWMAEREDTPWYPTARLFRQGRRDHWDDVFARMASGLVRLVASKSGAVSQPQAEPAISGAALVPISLGELVDKMTILEIKAQRIQDPAKVANVRTELALLAAARVRFSTPDQAVGHLRADLMRTNEMLWNIEDRIRDCERDKNFGPEFIELARSVYLTNDRRAVIKRQINDLAGSSIVEEKSYRQYS
jgi:tetratricopeptide (TPR) repeat protein